MARIPQGPQWQSSVYVAGVSVTSRETFLWCFRAIPGLYAPLLSLPLVGFHVWLDLLGESLVLPQLSLSITWRRQEKHRTQLEVKKVGEWRGGALITGKHGKKKEASRERLSNTRTNVHIYSVNVCNANITILSLISLNCAPNLWCLFICCVQIQ